jgi:flavin reductase (DIM6/NTAB) family NADH-FMN oxidoreductase RutF
VTPELRLITDHALESASVDDFADAMSALTTGVVVVTSIVDGRPWGTTAIAFTSVSADPPTVLVSLGSDMNGARSIAATGSFGVSILAEEQLAVARHASRQGAPKFLEPFVESDDARSATPVVAAALAHLDCELSETVRISDHTVFFGRVRDATSHDGTPLVYQRRDYRALADPTHRRTEKSMRCLSN